MTGKTLSDLQQGARAGRMGRREFMGRALALGATVGVASALWAQAAQATPRRGGHLRLGLEGGATGDTFVPWLANGADHATCAMFASFDHLTAVAADGSPVPQLAESWEVSADGATWAFQLRRGVEFHNGKSLTAADVVWSLQRHLTDESTFAEGKQILENLEELRADGDHTVIMKQKQVNIDLPVHMSALGFIIGQEGVDDWNAAVGTGPYKVTRWEPGVAFEAERYANFYRDDEAFFDSIELLNIPDPAARVNALITNSVDVIGQPDPNTAGRIAAAPGFELVEVQGAQHFTTAMRTDVDPFTNNHIRMAVKHGVKREEIVEKVLGGYGYVGNDHPIGRNIQFFAAELEQRVYDPDKARWHLQQAGLSTIDLALQTSDGAFAGAVDMSILMQASLAPTGVNVDVQRMPADGYWSNVWLTAPWCCVYWNGRPTVDWMLTSSYISTSSWNDTYFKNERFDRILAEARTETDEAKRGEMYFELQRILSDEGGTVVPAFGSFLLAASEKMGHGPVGAARRTDNDQLPRRWWFTA